MNLDQVRPRSRETQGLLAKFETVGGNCLRIYHPELKIYGLVDRQLGYLAGFKHSLEADGMGGRNAHGEAFPLTEQRAGISTSGEGSGRCRDKEENMFHGDLTKRPRSRVNPRPQMATGSVTEKDRTERAGNGQPTPASGELTAGNAALLNDAGDWIAGASRSPARVVRRVYCRARRHGTKQQRHQQNNRAHFFTAFLPVWLGTAKAEKSV